MAIFNGTNWFKANIAPYLALIKNKLDSKVSTVSSTDEAITRFDGTTGQVQNSLVTISDTGYITSPAGALLRSSVSIRPTSSDNHYGLLAVYAHESEIEVTTPRGAYFGYGHVGLQRVDLTLDGANQLYISGGKVKFAQDMILPNGAGLGKILTSDALGNATWQPQNNLISGDGTRGSVYASGNEYLGSSSYTKSYHIKMPYSVLVDNKMYHLEVRGYNYSTARNYNLQMGGYCYANGGTLHVHSEDYTESDAGYIIAVNQYAGANGGKNIYCNVKTGLGLHYHTLSMTNMLVGNGGAFQGDNEVIASDLDDISSDLAYGDRDSLITMTSSSGLLDSAFSDAPKLVDGVNSNDVKFLNGVGTGLSLQAQFTVSKTIKAIAIKQKDTTSHGAVDFEVSDDGTAWNNVGSHVAFGGFKRMPINTPTAGVYFRIKWVGDTTSSTPFLYELQFEE